MNNGTLRFGAFNSEGNNGEIRLAGGAKLVNTGTFVDDAQNTFGFGCGGDGSVAGSGSLVNSGTLLKDAGTATTPIDVPLENTGKVNVQSGAISPIGGGSSTAGTWTTTTGSNGRVHQRLVHVNQRRRLGRTIHDQRRHTPRGRTIDAARRWACACGWGVGSVGCGERVAVVDRGQRRDGLRWRHLDSRERRERDDGNDGRLHRRTISGTGTTLANNGTLRFGAFNNEGNNGEIRLAGGAKLVNAGTFVDDAQNTFGFGCGGDGSVAGSGSLVNSGTLLKDAGTATTPIDVPLENTGKVNVQSGAISPIGGGSSTAGTWTTTTGATVAFTSGSYTSTNDDASGAQFTINGGTLRVAEASTLPVAGLVLAGGALEVLGAVNVSRSLTAVNGATVSGGGTLTVASGASATMETTGGCTPLNVSGTTLVEQRHAALRRRSTTKATTAKSVSRGGAKLVNAGTFVDDAQNTFGFGCGGDGSVAGSGSLVNSGTLLKDAGTATTPIDVRSKTPAR